MKKIRLIVLILILGVINAQGNIISLKNSQYLDIFHAVNQVGNDIETTLVIDQNQIIAKNLTIPENIILEFHHGSSLIVKDGAILTINCEIDAGKFQIFNIISGDIIGEPKVTSTSYVEWIGASTDLDDNALYIEKMLKLFSIVTLSDGIYKIKNSIHMNGFTNKKFIFNPNAWILYSEFNNLPHIIGITGGKNIIIDNPQIDGNKFTGANGIGMNRSNFNDHTSNITIKGGTIKNCFRGKETKRNISKHGGGRAITAQMGVENLKIFGTTIFNCTTGIDVHASMYNNAPVNDIMVNEIYIEGCQEAFSFFALEGHKIIYDEDFSALELSQNMRVNVSNCFIKNCGSSNPGILKYQNGTSKNSNDGGVIVFINGKNVRFNNITVINEPSYGKIGGFYRGNGFFNSFSNITLSAECTSIINYEQPYNSDMDSTAYNVFRNRWESFENIHNLGTQEYILYRDIGYNGIENYSVENISINNIQISSNVKNIIYQVNNDLDVKNSTINVKYLPTSKIISGTFQQILLKDENNKYINNNFLWHSVNYLKELTKITNSNENISDSKYQIGDTAINWQTNQSNKYSTAIQNKSDEGHGLLVKAGDPDKYTRTLHVTSNNNDSLLMIKSKGKVGILNAEPKADLDVNGKIKSNELNVGGDSLIVDENGVSAKIKVEVVKNKENNEKVDYIRLIIIDSETNDEMTVNIPVIVK